MTQRPSSVIRLSVNFLRKSLLLTGNGRIATKLAYDGLQVSVHPGCAQGQGQGERSRDVIPAHLEFHKKIANSVFP